jgi:hypothetical protein
MSNQKGDDFKDQLERFFQTLTVDENQQIYPGLKKPGDACPVCGLGRLDYDGTLNLTCEGCGWVTSGGGACT